MALERKRALGLEFEWRYWDVHKAAATLLPILMVAFFYVTFTLSTTVDYALFRATSFLQPADYQLVLAAENIRQQLLPPNHADLDLLASVFGCFAFPFAFVAAATALNIPRRYRRRIEGRAGPGADGARVRRWDTHKVAIIVAASLTVLAGVLFLVAMY
jgi:hypothetical protein